METAAICTELLETWTTKLLEFQVSMPGQPTLDGGLLCPACGLIHGRSADAVYPLLCMAEKTDESRFIDAAIRLQQWSNSVSNPDGSFQNSPNNDWRGVTVSGATALAESVNHHGALLSDELRDNWRERVRRAADFLVEFYIGYQSNINDIAAGTYLLTLAHQMFEKPIYASSAKRQADACRKMFSENDLLIGEGNWLHVTEQGCRAVDLGYNVEGALPSLLLYARAAEDAAMEELVTHSLRKHLEFMLPDGGWDNSWGTRNFAWTYWGGRTSNGCQLALLLLANRNPIMGEAALRNAELLRTCTHDGLLCGGPHLYEAAIPTCLHHTIFHANTMAAVVDARLDAQTMQRTTLPRETATGTLSFPEIGTSLIAMGPWRATATTNDFQYANLSTGHVSGGALSFLYHMDFGPIFSASMIAYTMYEPQNMPLPRDVWGSHEELTPRIELRDGKRVFLSTVDGSARFDVSQTGDGILMSVRGRLLDINGNGPKGDPTYRLDYIFTDEGVAVVAEACGVEGAQLVLPVITGTKTPLGWSDGQLFVGKEEARLLFKSHKDTRIRAREERIYNFVSGFIALKCTVDLRSGKPETIEIIAQT